ncbi:MAG: alginate export family protein [Microvirga sp.]
MSTRRYDESYAYLGDPRKRTGAWWEPFKFIPVDPAGTSYLTLGLEMRLREEAYRNFDWGEVPVDNYQWYRILPYADLHLGPYLRLFGQGIGAWSTGKETPVTGVDETGIELLQGFADLKLPLTPDAQLTLRGGRQLLSYGSERLVSLRYGPNVLRSFDAGLASLETGPWRIDTFIARPVRNRIDSLDDTEDRNRSVWSLYATRTLDGMIPGAGAGLDLYYVGYRNEDARFNQGAGREERHTFGSRFFGRTQGWDWNFEAMIQYGSFGAGDIGAWSVASDTGYTFASLPFSPRFGLRANIISGDRNPGNPDLQTFNPLFPKGKYFGETGLIGPYNLLNLHPGLVLQLDDRWTLSAAAVFYWRESLGDGVYDTSGGLVRASDGSDARYIGTQADIVLGWAPTRWFSAELAYSAFVAGQFIEDTGPSRTTHFVGLEASVKF